MTSARLPAGGHLDRDKTVRFCFDGKTFSGHPGDTLASALLANNEWLLARSFKYHRPRSVLTADAAEPNALVTVGEGAATEPNVRATVLELYEGLQARSQNNWPSVGFDIGAINGLLSPLLRAGFYYKTFMWPASFWEKLYEPLIRRAAGLGEATSQAGAERYEQRWSHCDLLVIGAGPAGLSAALTAARAGAKVMIADEQAWPGGCETPRPDSTSPGPGETPAERQFAELLAMPNVRSLLRTTVFGWYDSGVFGALERPGPAPDAQPAARLWRIVCKAAIMATGAHERPLVFNGNDRPGIMLAGALHTYVNRFAVRPGQAVAFITNNDSAYRCAADLLAAGVKVTTIIDRRAVLPASAQGLERLGVRLISNAHIVATAGRRRLRSVTIARNSGHTTETLAVDTLGMSGGYSPVVHLSCQRGARPLWDPAAAHFAAPADSDGLYACGAAAGYQAHTDCAGHGEQVATRLLDLLGLAPATGSNGQPGSAAFAPRQPDTEPTPAAPASWTCGGPADKAFVDFQNDVTAADLSQAVQEGYAHVELAKRYTTAGMATDQGKSGNVNASGLLAEARQCTPGETGTTTFRPFYTPVPFGALAGQHRGEHYRPRRRSPLHEWAESLGARFTQVGHWDRAAWFPRTGESSWQQAVHREVQSVRQAVGLCDVSTLGKIELFGADSAEFLNRVYCNKFLKLPLNKARYGLMLREDGFVLDDGTTSRLGEQHYLMTTTTGAAAEVLNHLEWCHQVLWPDLQVQFASVSDQWAQMAIAGPASRELLQQLVSDDLSEQAFPFLGARPVSLRNGLNARLFRISFSGELAYELAVPADYGNSTAHELMRLGAPLGITPYGTEAMGILRIEKGFVTHAEIDGRVTPADLGLDRLAAPDKAYVGHRLLRRPALLQTDRPQLVGLLGTKDGPALRAGAHLLGIGQSPSMANDQGHVSSACFSPSLDRPIALAMLRNGRARHGETIIVWDGLQETRTEATVTDPGAMLLPGQIAASPAPAREPSNTAVELPLPVRQAALPGELAGECAPMPAGQLQITVGPPTTMTLILNATNGYAAAASTATDEQPSDSARPWLPGQTLWLGTNPEAGDGQFALDLSHARCNLTVAGPAAIDLLAHGTAVDLESMPIGAKGSCTTALDTITVLLTRLAPDRFEVLVTRSYARSLLDLLILWGQPWLPIGSS